MNFWRRLHNVLGRGEKAFVAFVADHSKHSPGTRGAKLIVTQDEKWGTIGGGVMEHRIIEEGRKRLSLDSYFDVETLAHRESGTLKRSGLFCAGEQRMVYAVISPGTEAHDRISTAATRSELDEGGFVELSEHGVRIVDDEWDFESAPIALVDGSYRELLLNPFRAAIVGGGHCGAALWNVLQPLGYALTMFDTRERDRAVRVGDYRQAAGLLKFPELTHIVVMTADMPSDVAALNGVGALPFPYIGVMGSPAKIARIKQEIPDTLGEKIVAPIGLPMASNTPQEIAVSIAAEILSVREDLFPWTRGGVHSEK